MRSVVAIGWMLGACNVSGALEVVVEIDPQVPVDEVQLYVGLGDHQNDSSERLIPGGYRYPETPSGFYWKRDVNGDGDVVGVPAGASDVRFVFREGSHAQLTAIVVGYKAGEIVAATSLPEAFLEDGTVRQYHVELKPASAAFPRPVRKPITVHRWGPSATDTRCAYLEDPTNPIHPSIFVVDHRDRDCDGLEERADEPNPLECLPDVHLGATRPERTNTRCLTTDVIPNTAVEQACVLGGPACVDGRGRVPGSCEPSTTCAPPQACIACKDRMDALDCMANATATSTTATRIECTIGTKLDVMGRTVCPGDPTLTSRFGFLPMCKPDAPYLFWATGKNMWVDRALTGDGLTLTASAPTLDCGLTLKVTGEIPDLDTPEPIRSLLNVQLANKRSVAVPIVINFSDNNCGEASECKVAGDLGAMPALAACVGSAVIEPW